jgi:DNA-binding transcriptional MerR regulator
VATPGISIGAVSKRTGIPVTTLRFYERELPRLFPIRKTGGGHRRYDDRDVSRFATLRALTEEGLPLAEVKRALRTRGEDPGLSEAIEKIFERLEAGERAASDLARRVEALEARLAGRDEPPPRRSWFGKR